MSLADHLDGVREVMHLVFGISPDQVGPKTVQADVPEWDSVGHLNLMLGLEGRFGVTLAVSDLTRLTSLKAILDYLSEACPST